MRRRFHNLDVVTETVDFTLYVDAEENREVYEEAHLCEMAVCFSSESCHWGAPGYARAFP